MLKRHSSRFRKILAGIALSGIMGLCGAQVRADDCQKRVERADHRLHEAIKAKRRNTRVMSFRKRVNNVGTEIIAGGTRTESNGATNEIGTITTTKITAITTTTVASDSLD